MVLSRRACFMAGLSLTAALAVGAGCFALAKSARDPDGLRNPLYVHSCHLLADLITLRDPSVQFVRTTKFQPGNGISIMLRPGNYSQQAIHVRAQEYRRELMRVRQMYYTPMMVPECEVNIEAPTADHKKMMIGISTSQYP